MLKSKSEYYKKLAKLKFRHLAKFKTSLGRPLSTNNSVDSSQCIGISYYLFVIAVTSL
ncbi:hypothetical protein RhiirA5_446374 [Rhizophagus irregularis]|uniref:Uncharacterized protein n=1 Tax=Rhizophagus irregularis TaxID=588596 RepID=A0A2N0NBT0_9GLOM|nr:hypothetical protein RhiirA5_446374 [Rhizophagus irregularis]